MTTREPKINRAALFADLGYAPHPGQLEVHRSTATRRIVACGVRWGKTKCAAMEAIAAALEPASLSMGWIVAPTYDLADRVFREIQLTVFQHMRHRVVAHKEHERRLVLRNLGGGVSEIRGKTADNPVSLLGEGLDWVVIDEAARLKPAIWESHLTQRLVDKNGWALLISTPRGKGYLFDLFRRGQADDPDYASWNCPSWTNPFLDRAVIDAERARLPDRVFMQEYGAQFIEGSGAVFRNVRECATGSFQGPQYRARYVAGLDLAKVEDYTVLVIMARADRSVVFVDRFHRLDWQFQVNRIHGALEKYNRCWATVDVTGIGDPIFEALSAGGCNVEPYGLTSKSKNALINHLSISLERKRIILPRPEIWPDGIDELESFEFSVTDRGNVRSSAPSGQHDDCVMALAMAAWNFPLDDRPSGRFIPIG